MHVAVVHGYFLNDSGSGVYARELSRALVSDGHEVTLICQEQNPIEHNFINEFYKLNEKNSSVSKVFARGTKYRGFCRLVQPNIDRKLLTFAPGKFGGFISKAFQEAAKEEIKSYLNKNIKALTNIFNMWPPDFIQANHIIMQPYIALKVVGKSIPVMVSIQGSALNFSVRNDQRLVPYAVKGLSEASSIVVQSELSYKDTLNFARKHNLDAVLKTYMIMPGVDTEKFYPFQKRRTKEISLDGFSIKQNDDVLIYIGALIWTKGIQYLLASIPKMLQKRPLLKLIIAGKGSQEKFLKELINALDKGALEDAYKLAESEKRLEGCMHFGPIIPRMSGSKRNAYIEAAKDNIKKRIFFAGHVSHEQLAKLERLADLAVVPSIFPEAFGLVSTEALSSGALPVVTYQSGLRTVIDAMFGSFNEPLLKALVPGVELTEKLADVCLKLLDKHPTKDPKFKKILHNIAKNNFSWAHLSREFTHIYESITT